MQLQIEQLIRFQFRHLFEWIRISVMPYMFFIFVEVALDADIEITELLHNSKDSSWLGHLHQEYHLDQQADHHLWHRMNIGSCLWKNN